MKSARRALALALIGLGLSSVAALSACRGILGIEERTYSADGGAVDCADYCGVVMDACTGDHAQYPSLTICLAVCADLPIGSLADTSGDTVGCRLRAAKDVLATGERDGCYTAGPMGNGICGETCDNYCSLLPKICPEEVPNLTPDCAASCMSAPSRGPFHVPTPDEGSIECRIYHLCNATENAPHHCPHASGREKCVDINDAGSD